MWVPDSGVMEFFRAPLRSYQAGGIPATNCGVDSGHCLWGASKSRLLPAKSRLGRHRARDWKLGHRSSESIGDMAGDAKITSFFGLEWWSFVTAPK